MLKAGFAQINITPKLGMMIPGYFNVRIADGIIDPLYARAFVLDDGNTVIAAVIFDLILASEATTAEVRRMVTEATGIPAENIMVGATHTHTGSSTDHRSTVSTPDEDYVQLFRKSAADAIVTAYNNRTDAKIGYGSQDEFEVGFNRRYFMKDGTLKTNPGLLNPNIDHVAAPIDPQVGVIRVDTADDKPLGAIVNFTVHPDVVSGNKYCSDYIGELARTLKKVYGEDFGVVYMNGCCGDINHIDALGGTNLPHGRQHLKMGRILAGDAIAIIERTQTSASAELGAAYMRFTATRRRPSDADYEWALKAIDDPNTSNVDLSYAKQWKDMYENPIPDPTLEVQSLAISFIEPHRNGKLPGDIAICSMPGEIFVEIGLDLKAESPFAHVMISELSNGCFGYIATRKAIEEGGYETRITKLTNLDKHTHRRLVDNQLELHKKLKKQ
nr:neutral/alkaline non-lysosomal ceramidase N-terminal domain-containing protein [Clostridia bacterium]